MIKHIKLLIFILWGLIITMPQLASSSINPFPSYPNISPNVAFWKIVYSKYSSEHGLIHDSKNLAVIYKVIDLRDRKIAGNSRRNRKTIKAAKKKYSKILRKLASGHKASSALEKKIITMFGGHPSPQVLREAARNVRFQLCLKNRFRQGIINSGRYLAEMKQIFRKNHLPTDLVYLPHVESSFNYEAYSKFGAAGIWQFIRSTGRRFLTVNYTVDERRDPIMATEAAAKYLKENYQKLGSWPMALTAYNHGATSMFRAQKKFGAYDKIIEKYQNKRFGFASKNFYPEFLAAREISKHYQRYFPNLHVDKAIITDNFILKGYADINDLAKNFNINTNQIKKLNPSLRRPIFSGQKYIPKHYQLKLPKGTIAKLTGVPAISYKKSQKRSRFYRVARGDTAGKIARMQRVKLRDLLDFNQLNRRAVIYVGQNLRIPAPGEQRLASLSPSISKPQRNKVSMGGRKRPLAKPLLPAKQIKPVKKSTEINSIPSGIVANSHEQKPQAVDIPPQIAPKTAAVPSQVEQQKPIKLAAAITSTDTTLAMLKSHTTDWQTDVIQLLTSHQATPQVAQVDAIEQPAVVPRPQNLISVNPEVLVGNFQIEKVYTDKHGKKIGVVQIEESETLGHYADWLDIPTQRIRNLNHLTFHRQIKTHQKIKIPLGSIGKEAFEERRYEFHKEISEDFFAAFKVTGVQTYTVKRGDNIWTITHDALDLPFWLMNKYNLGVNFENLHPGQKLLFPVVEKI